MKKNKMMRIASALLIAVLLTTCAISGTFAKYVTTGHTEDTARVAKWGVQIQGSANNNNYGNFFTETYAKDDADYAGVNTVISTSGDVLAPGTKLENVAAIKITGSPEVAVNVELVGAVTLTNWEVDDAFYCPIVFTIKDNSGAVVVEIDGKTYTSSAELEAAVETYINNFSAVYAPNTALDNQLGTAMSISWAWAFEGDNVKDTALGNAAATGTAASIKIEIDATVTQID